MSERSVQCPVCPFSFARLVDAADYHAYHCPTCDWKQPTTDRRPGNRPADVCSLCDRAIDLTVSGYHGLHLYIGNGWIHGGGKEYAPVHSGCLNFADIDRLLTYNREHWLESLDFFRDALGIAVSA